MGKLRVHLIRGEGLKAADAVARTSDPDPFVKLDLGGQTFTSKMIRKSLQPHWNAQFEFEGVRSVLASTPLVLEVYDWNPRLSGLTTFERHSALHVQLGSATVDLTPMLDGSWKMYNVELAEPKGRPAMWPKCHPSAGPQLVPCASSGRAWCGSVQLGIPRVRPSHWNPATASGARASRL